MNKVSSIKRLAIPNADCGIRNAEFILLKSRPVLIDDELTG